MGWEDMKVPWILGCRCRGASGPAGFARHLSPPRLHRGMPALVLRSHISYTLQGTCCYTSACQQGRYHDELLAMQVQASLQHHLSFRNEAYILTLHAHTGGAPAEPKKGSQGSTCSVGGQHWSTASFLPAAGNCLTMSWLLFETVWYDVGICGNQKALL